MAHLVAAGGHRVELQPERTRFGEDPANEIPVQKGFGLAPTHFIIQSSLAGHILVDQTGQGATRVDGQPAQSPIALQNGSVIEAGRLQLRYETDQKAHPPTGCAIPPQQTAQPATSPAPTPAKQSEADDDIKPHSMAAAAAAAATGASDADERYVSELDSPVEEDDESGSLANTLLFFGIGSMILPLVGYEFVIFSFMEDTTILGVVLSAFGGVMKLGSSN